MIARLLTPAATAGAFYTLTYQYAADWWNRRVLRGLAGHTVVIGMNPHGRAFVDGCMGDVAILDPLGQRASSRSSQIRTFKGSGLDPGALRQVGVDRASAVFIVTDDDAENLRVLSNVLAVARRDSRTDVLVRIDNHLLARQLDRDDEFVRPPGTSSEVQAFNVDRVAAQRLLHDYPLVDLASLHLQRRVHVVILGWNGFALEFMEQLARLGPCRRLDCPRVDVFARNPVAARSEIVAMQPAFGADLDGRSIDSAARVLTIRVHELTGGTAIPTAEQLVVVEPDHRRLVTAVVVAAETDEESASVAIALRERTNAAGRWQAPMFVRMRYESRLTELMERRDACPNPADRIHAIAAITQTCRLDLLASERERGAQAFHAAYRETAAAQPRDGAASGVVDVPWQELPQTYRNASRRAVDHLPIKLLSAGYYLESGPLGAERGLDISSNQREVEELASLEHASWRVDRLLDGWRPGRVRDDSHRVNPAVGVAYRELDSTLGRSVTLFDVQQIRAAARYLSRSGLPSVRREVRLGVFGHIYLSVDAASEAERALPEALAPFLEAHHRHFISLVTPLAPGSDLILTHAIASLLSDQGMPHRILVVRTLPVQAMLADFLCQRDRAEAWTVPHQPLPSQDADATVLLKAELDRALSRPDSLVVNLEPAGSRLEHWVGEANASRRKRAYRRANTFLASQCDVLLALVDPTRPGSHRETPKGGTEDGLHRARRLAARRRRHGEPERPSLIVLEAGSPVFRT